MAVGTLEEKHLRREACEVLAAPPPCDPLPTRGRGCELERKYYFYERKGSSTNKAGLLSSPHTAENKKLEDRCALPQVTQPEEDAGLHGTCGRDRERGSRASDPGAAGCVQRVRRKGKGEQLLARQEKQRTFQLDSSQEGSVGSS